MSSFPPSSPATPANPVPPTASEPMGREFHFRSIVVPNAAFGCIGSILRQDGGRCGIVFALLFWASALAARAEDALPPEARALVVLDSRLHHFVAPELVAYVSAAEARREFPIAILPVDGIDDWKPPRVRASISAWLASNPKLEGILFVGNIKLPSFFMPRPDLPETRLWPRYYEDPELVAERTIAPGTILQPASGANPTWPFIAGEKEFAVPEHDFDDLHPASATRPRLWTAYLPVGYAEDSRNTYGSWAKQLAPFFKKALGFYQHPDLYDRSIYIVSNDLSVLTRAGSLWESIGPRNIEFYSINEKGPGAFKDNPAGYSRTDLGKYGSLKEFADYAGQLPWMDEGWQSPEVFLSHMKASQRRVVCWNVHSNPELSLLNWQQARSMEGGGLVAVMLGCGVAGYTQPGSTSNVDTATPVDRNVMVNVVYGKSAFVAATGSPFARVRDENGTPFYRTLYGDGSYLGRAHLLRLRDGQPTSPRELRQQQEILIGDPFVDARGTP
jgi:hypothetical protein